MKTEEYFERISEETEEAYKVAREARNQSKDPEQRVDIPVATDLPEKASSLVIAAQFPELEDKGVPDRIRELEDEYGKNDERVAFQIAREIAEGRFHEFDEVEKACDAGIRVGVSYMTGGITTAPLEGIGEIKVRENDDGSRYLAIYYSGPIRSAGGTASAMSVLIGDYVRIGVGLDKFKPSDKVINRYATEVEDYYNRVTAKQYNPTREETKKIAENVPIEVTGSPTEDLDVSNYKDLDRIDTNKIRGGMCLVYLDGLPLKASKIKKRIEKWGKDFGLEHWEWIEDYLELQKEIHSSDDDDDGEEGEKEEKYTANDKYLGSLTAGRPVFAHPGRKGGFRIRYGHSRTNGLAAVSFHPATMEISQRFIAIGTQLKVEYPMKGTVGTPCDSIEPPIVRLENGEVVKVKTREKAQEIESQIDEILFMGDMLVTYGEFIENGKKLLPSPYVEEWWEKELEKALDQKDMELGKDFSDRSPTPEEAEKISKAAEVRFHPKWTHFWTDVDPENFKNLYNYLRGYEHDAKKAKKALEQAHIPHGKDLDIETEHRKAVEILLNTKEDHSEKLDGIQNSKEIPRFIKEASGIEIGKQSTHYIGARMGRPEKAEKRTLTGKPQMLFPCGKEEGGRMRNLSAAYSQTMHGEQGIVREDIIHNRCDECEEITFYSFCRDCNAPASPIWFCSDCKEEYKEEPEECDSCGNERFQRYKEASINVKEMMDNAMENLGMREPPELLKSFRGMTSKHKHVEPIEKGLLRQKHGLYVNKDATVRYDALDIPMTHFRPREISTTVEKLKEMGYKQDINGEPLESENQLIALKPQDIVIPGSDKSQPASEYMLKVAKFIDELLEELYGMDPYYNAEVKEDLIGALVIGLAPHTSGGTVGRIIGFTEAKGMYAHPYWHAAKRRNCLPGDTEIKLSDSSSKSLKQIYESASDPVEADNTGTIEKDIDLDVISVDGGKVENKKAVKVIRTPAQEFKIALETKAGRKLEVFPDHKVKTANGVKRARELEEGDKMITPAKLEIEAEDTQKVDILEYVSDEEVSIRGVTDKLETLIEKAGGLKPASDKLEMSKKTLFNYKSRNSVPLNVIRRLESITGEKIELGNCKIAAKRDKVTLDRYIQIDSKFMKLLGYYLAEGHSRKSEKQGEEFYQVALAFGEDDLEHRMNALIEDVFDISPHRQDNNLVISSKLIYQLFEGMEIGEGAHSKRMPEFVKKLPKEKVAPMISTYFAGDGSVEEGILHIQATSVSRELLQDIETQLKRFGIYARYSTSEREAGGILLEKCGAEKYEGQTFIPHNLHIRSSYATKFGKEIGFDLIRKQKAVEEDYRIERKPRVECNEEVIHEEIKSIETKKADERFMYDLEVEENHNFLTSDNLITNNCDGDEDAILLLMDGLLNFSRDFLPDMTGARSVTDDTRVFTKIDGEIRGREISEIVDGVLDAEGFETRPDGFEVNRSFDKDIKVASFEENGDVKFKDVSALIRHENDKQVYEVKTTRGEIKVTGDHSVFTTRGEEIEAKPVRDLEQGEAIITPSNPDLETEGLPEKIDLFELLDDEECYVDVPESELEELNPEIKDKADQQILEKYGEHNVYRYRTGRRAAPLKFYKEVGVVPSCKVRTKSGHQSIKRELENRDELYRLLGYLLSEGALDRGDIYNTETELIEDARNCIETLTGVKPELKTDQREDRKPCYSVRVPETFMQALERLGLKREKFDEKRVPSFVFGAEESHIEEFIKAYRAGDGSIYEEKGFSKLYTKSGEMAFQLAMLLRKTGFKTSTHIAGETWEVLYSEWQEKDPYWPLWDLNDEIREALYNEGETPEEVQEYLSNYRKNNRLKTASKQKIVDLYEKGINQLRPAVEGDLAVERVKEVNEIGYGDKYVYDLEVPGAQNFLCGPHPIFAHNTMDAPLILSTIINPDEVDDEAWAVETVSEYPLEFYEETQKYKKPWELDCDIEIGEDIVHSDEPFTHGFTHETADIDDGPSQSEYVTLDEMSDKTRAQLGIGEKIKAVDEDDVAELLLQKHFLPDIRGNLRSFSKQEVRCVDCNEKFRRVPMNRQTIAPTGKTTAECPECGGKILLTISEGTIKKYMQPSKDIIDEYEVTPYLRQQVLMLNESLQGLFGKDQRQSGLGQFT